MKEKIESLLIVFTLHRLFWDMIIHPTNIHDIICGIIGLIIIYISGILLIVKLYDSITTSIKNILENNEYFRQYRKKRNNQKNKKVKGRKNKKRK